MVTVLRTGTATKLSPRGNGQLTYQVGRMDDTVLLRISGNESSGRFSRAWRGGVSKNTGSTPCKVEVCPKFTASSPQNCVLVATV